MISLDKCHRCTGWLFLPTLSFLSFLKTSAPVSSHAASPPCNRQLHFQTFVFFCFALFNSQSAFTTQIIMIFPPQNNKINCYFQWCLSLKLPADRLSWMRHCFVLFPHLWDIISASPETCCFVDVQRLMENSSPPISPV